MLARSSIPWSLMTFSALKSRIEGLRFQPKNKSKIFHYLCRMVCLPVLRPFFKNDVRKLASHFQKNGYMKGNGVFYVALEDNEGKTVKEEVKRFEETKAKGSNNKKRRQ